MNICIMEHKFRRRYLVTIKSGNNEMKFLKSEIFLPSGSIFKFQT